MGIGSDQTGVKRSLAVTVGLMASIVTAIVGLAALNRATCQPSPGDPANGIPEETCRTSSSSGHGSGGGHGSSSSSTKSTTHFGGFGQTGHAYGSGAHG